MHHCQAIDLLAVQPACNAVDYDAETKKTKRNAERPVSDGVPIQYTGVNFRHTGFETCFVVRPPGTKRDGVR